MLLRIVKLGASTREVFGIFMMKAIEGAAILLGRLIGQSQFPDKRGGGECKIMDGGFQEWIPKKF
jgi:hypothetical protein